MATVAPSLSDLIRLSEEKKKAAQLEAESNIQSYAEAESENLEVSSTKESAIVSENESAQGEEAVEKKRKRGRFDQVDENFFLKRKKSKWAAEHTKLLFPPLISHLPMGLSEDLLEAFLLRVRLEDINRRHMNPAFGIDPSEERSPSPEPTYDNMGRRTNTRDIRIRNSINRERTALIEKAQNVCSSFRPPADFKVEKKKLEMKLRVPIDRYPDYNFFGLIIGPRGNTQKRLEKETGCKIVIRGKGSSKEGKGKKDGKPAPGEDEPLHVLVTAETQECLAKGVEELKRLLTPVDDENNEHKRKQLMELAAINGTLRENETCAYCGLSGHRHWQCPERKGTPWKSADIVCAWCGDKSHPSNDCPRKGSGLPPLQPKLIPVNTPTPAATSQPEIDKELEMFMNEIGDSSSAEQKPPTQEPTVTVATSAPPPPQHQPWHNGPGQMGRSSHPPHSNNGPPSHMMGRGGPPMPYGPPGMYPPPPPPPGSGYHHQYGGSHQPALHHNHHNHHHNYSHHNHHPHPHPHHQYHHHQFQHQHGMHYPPHHLSGMSGHGGPPPPPPPPPPNPSHVPPAQMPPWHSSGNQGFQPPQPSYHTPSMMFNSAPPVPPLPTEQPPLPSEQPPPPPPE